jgi:hypothetical protein
VNSPQLIERVQHSPGKGGRQSLEHDFEHCSDSEGDLFSTSS